MSRKGRSLKDGFMAAGETRKALFWRAPGLTVRTDDADGSGCSADRSLSSASMVPNRRNLVMKFMSC